MVRKSSKDFAKKQLIYQLVINFQASVFFLKCVWQHQISEFVSLYYPILMDTNSEYKSAFLYLVNFSYGVLASVVSFINNSTLIQLVFTNFIKNVNFLNVEYTWRHQALDNETKTFDNLKTRPVVVWNHGATLSNTNDRLK